MTLTNAQHPSPSLPGASALPRSPLCTTAEAAAYLRRPVETLRWWRNTDRGPAWVRDGRRVFYPADELVAYVEALRTTA